MAALPPGRSADCLKAYLARRKAIDLRHSALLVNASAGRLSTQGVAELWPSLRLLPESRPG